MYVIWGIQKPLHNAGSTRQRAYKSVSSGLERRVAFCEKKNWSRRRTVVVIIMVWCSPSLNFNVRLTVYYSWWHLGKRVSLVRTSPKNGWRKITSKDFKLDLVYWHPVVYLYYVNKISVPQQSIQFYVNCITQPVSTACGHHQVNKSKLNTLKLKKH
jgi:hypothetical protein